MTSRFANIASVAVLMMGAWTPASAGDFIFGVGTHFAFPETRGYFPATQRPQLMELGVDSIRDDVHEGAFAAAEPDRPLGRNLDRLNGILVDRKTRPVLILMGRELMDKPVSRSAPTSPRETAMFAQFGARLAAATRDFNPIYEIWNEWNTHWRPHSPGPLGVRSENPDHSPENYVAVAKASHAAIKAVNPGALVLTGAIGDDEGWNWSRRALKAGLAQTGDGISVHFYNHCNPPAARTAENMIEKVESFRRMMQEEIGANPPPLYITEFGWPNDDGPCGISRELAAANLAQFTLWTTTKAAWLKGIWAYEMRDSGRNRTDREDNFGLYDYENRAKPAACMYREAINLARSLKDARFLQTKTGVRWLEGATSDGKTTWVIWTTGRDSRASIASRDGAPLAGRALCSAGTQAAPVGQVGMTPIVLTADRPRELIVVETRP